LILGVNELKNQKIKIYDLVERLIEKVCLKTNRIEGKNLTPGIYFVKLKVGNKVWREKITKIG